ncbi:MAG: hypothetical protein AAFW00_19165, partial [Bacteroidota bacterium]
SPYIPFPDLASSAQRLFLYMKKIRCMLRRLAQLTYYSHVIYLGYEKNTMSQMYDESGLLGEDIR